MTTHTPWRLEVDVDDGVHCVHARVWGPAVHIDSSANPLPIADMRLIAAAPELLGALTELTAWVNRAIVPGYTDRKPMPENCAKALAAASAAIAKATGAQP